MSVARTVPILRFDCVYLLHVLDRQSIQTVVPTIIGEIKTELISELKFVIKSAVTQAIEDAIEPLQDCINKQNDKITCLKAENDKNGISSDLYRCL
jgi:hypothetical protein